MLATCGEVQHTQLSWTEWSQRLFVSSDLLLSLAVFYLSNLAAMLPLSVFYRYFHANCSSELANCMPPLLPRPRNTCLSSHAHPYTVQTPFARVNQYLQSFLPSTGKLWNRLPASVFPSDYGLNAFKRGVSRHLCNQN